MSAIGFSSLRCLVLAIALFNCSTVIANSLPTWQLRVEEKSGFPTLSYAGADGMSSTLNFWGKGWAWADTSTEFKITAPYRYEVRANNKVLDFEMSSQTQKENESRLQTSIRIDARSMRQDVIGGGIIFRFDINRFGPEMGEPILLPNNAGWSWGKDGLRKIEVRFSPALPHLYFERGNKSELRAFFYKDNINPGASQYTMTVIVTGDIKIGPTIAERFGGSAPQTWPSDSISLRSSPVDLSFLNTPEKPAGKRGFVRAVGDALVFEDNARARFWGTNLSAYTLFSTPSDAIKTQAKRLSALGFNLVRLHHHDSPWVSPNIFGNPKTITDTQRINADALGKIDWWIKCLKDEGIYVWLDLHVGRSLRAGDNIYGFAEIAKGKDTSELKGYNYVNITLQQAMKRFAADYLSHVNPHTGLAYKDDPAIAAILLTNENDITHHFSNSLLPDKGVPEHSKIYMNEANAFASRHNLPKDKVWRSWEHGPSKIFLNDLEARFNTEMIQHLRELGVKVPIATTNTWGGNAISSLPALTTGDIIDVHSYGGVGQLEKNPLVTGGIAHWIAAAQILGKPLTVTEWNAEPFPTPDRHTLPLYIAGMASHQGWDALMQYAYAQEGLGGGYVSASNWHAYNDPSLLATLPAAALMYRRGDVKDATTQYVFDPGQLLFNQAITPDTSVALRTAAEVGKLSIAMPQTKELPWLKRPALPANAIVLRSPDQSAISPNEQRIKSDTGELMRDWSQGMYTISTPRTQAAMGWIGGKEINLPDIKAKVVTPANATLSVQSLGGEPISQAKDILISIGSRSVPQPGNKVPFYVEPVTGSLSIRAPKGLKLYRTGTNQQLEEVPVSYTQGGYEIQLGKHTKSSWLYLK